MNQIQRYILVAVIVVLVAMIAYPPFHSVFDGGRVINQGYHWILSPPYTATVNVSMLLVQWIGVLVVGGIAFFLAKGISLPSGSSHNKSTDATLPISNIEEVKDKESRKHKDKSKGISQTPLSILFGAFGAIIGRNVAIIIGFSTPIDAGVKVVIFMAIGLAMGSFIGSMIINFINSKVLTRSKGVLLAWGAALVGVVVYFILFAYTQRPQREANNPLPQHSSVTKEPAAPAPAAAPDLNIALPINQSQHAQPIQGQSEMPPITIDINRPELGFIGAPTPYVGAYNNACRSALQNDAMHACYWLRFAINVGFKDWRYLQTDKDFDNIRNEKCFVDIIKENIRPTR